MNPPPVYISPDYKGSGKLQGKVAIITGGDSGIGRAVAVHFAREGADVAIMYLNEHQDAKAVKKLVEAEGRRCITIAGDVGDPEHCRQSVEDTVKALGRLDILVNNAAEQHLREDIRDISDDMLERVFRTNVFAMFYMTQAALDHLPKGSAIINTTSINAYKGYPELIDYTATKGAILAFTRSLALNLAKKGIRVNGVAPGPIWTPLIPSTFEEDFIETFGQDTPMGRPGQPYECATAYVFLASSDSSYYTGQVLHPNGGAVVNA